jgi:hypothetical protein
MDLSEADKAAARTYFSTSAGQQLLSYLRAKRPLIGDFTDFKSDRQFDVSVGEVKGWELCVRTIEKIFEREPDSGLLDSEPMTDSKPKIEE